MYTSVLYFFTIMASGVLMDDLPYPSVYPSPPPAYKRTHSGAVEWLQQHKDISITTDLFMRLCMLRFRKEPVKKHRDEEEGSLIQTNPNLLWFKLLLFLFVGTAWSFSLISVIGLGEMTGGGSGLYFHMAMWTCILLGLLVLGMPFIFMGFRRFQNDSSSSRHRQLTTHGIGGTVMNEFFQLRPEMAEKVVTLLAEESTQYDQPFLSTILQKMAISRSSGHSLDV